MEQKDAVELRNDAGDFINIGSGKELAIKVLAETIRSVVYEKELSSELALDEVCRIIWDRTKPNGTPRKLCDISRLRDMGFIVETELREGIKKAYDDFVNRMINQD
jgi:GDP-L-fucose synthase